MRSSIFGINTKVHLLHLVRELMGYHYSLKLINLQLECNALNYIRYNGRWCLRQILQCLFYAHSWIYYDFSRRRRLFVIFFFIFFFIFSPFFPHFFLIFSSFLILFSCRCKRSAISSPKATPYHFTLGDSFVSHYSLNVNLYISSLKRQLCVVFVMKNNFALYLSQFFFFFRSPPSFYLILPSKNSKTLIFKLFWAFLKWFHSHLIAHWIILFHSSVPFLLCSSVSPFYKIISVVLNCLLQTDSQSKRENSYLLQNKSI